MPPGRRAKVDAQLLIEVLKKNRSLIRTENSFVPKTDDVWKLISKEVKGTIEPATIYSYVTNDRFNLKTILFGDQQSKILPNSINGIETPEIVEDEEDEQDESASTFILTFGKTEFDDLIMETQRCTKDLKGITKMYIINIFKPGQWTEVVSKKIFDDFRLLHGYHFKNSYISKDKESGYFTGQCQCGSLLECRILSRMGHQEVVKIQCTASKGKKKCGKRQCRGLTREKVVDELKQKSTEAYRTTKAAEIMREGDSAEPPHLYSAAVLRKAKHQFIQQQYRDPDPLVALSKLKRSLEGQNIVRDIGLDPIFVHFWSPHQVRIYNELIKAENARLCIDATGGLARYFKHVDGQNSQHVFLYLGVLYCSSGQIAVFASFSEHQDTVTICTLLQRFLQSGGDLPKEVVTDSSRALLNACCWAFTKHHHITSYANACMSGDLPKSYIRIDYAHYMKKWSDAIVNEKKPVKKFYLFAISQLIICQSKNIAERIVKAILIISQSETAGNGAETLQHSLEFIKELICETNSKNKEIEKTIEEIFCLEESSVFDQEKDVTEDMGMNQDCVLEKWITKMVEEVDKTLKSEEGDDLNPRYCPKVASRLKKQLKTIPLWSSICRNEYGYGRVPASSAPVESEFKILKKQVIPDVIRIDMAIETLVKHYNGKLKLIDSSAKLKNNSTIRIISEASEMDKENHSVDSLEKSQPDVLRSPLKDLSSELNSTTISSCIACQNGHFSTGAHKCIICNSNIHVLPGCSVAIGNDEGYGEKRVCMACHNSSSKVHQIALNEVENWRNLGHPRKKTKRSYYLTKGNLEMFEYTSTSKGRSLPILTNGNSPNLHFVNLRDAKLSVRNTCAIDSIFQVLLAGFVDRKPVENYVRKYKKANSLFDMVADVADARITKKTYQKRAEVYINFFKKDVRPQTIEDIICDCNIVSLVNHIFKSTPSFEESSSCVNDCHRRIKYLPTITINDQDLQKPLTGVIKDYVALRGAPCIRDNCGLDEKNDIHKIADVILLGIDTDKMIPLDSFQLSFSCPKTSATYELLGILNYNGPRTRRPGNVGHYTAIARRNMHWVLYDDLKTKSKLLTDQFTTNSELLVFAKR